MASGNFYIDKTVAGDYKVCMYNDESDKKMVTFFI